MIPKYVLIADDNCHVRAMVRCFLESRPGFAVCGEAVNGLDAIEKALALNPDVILLDFAMPMMNGIEAAFLLKIMLPEIPVILFTALDSAAMESEAIAAGIRAIVPKNDMGRLAGHLESLLV
jgi:DNA-binding NarL/FixJ family response regulator